jgi:hypothetical protein
MKGVEKVVWSEMFGDEGWEGRRRGNREDHKDIGVVAQTD